MAQMNMIEAIRSGLDVVMDKDPSVVIMGEDVGYFGGVFRCTDGLQRKYGEPTPEALVEAEMEAVRERMSRFRGGRRGRPRRGARGRPRGGPHGSRRPRRGPRRGRSRWCASRPRR